MTTQTYKTIIFEEFNSDADDLYTILENADDPESNKLVEKIDELSVNSFAQFMKKFAPKVYEVCQSIDGNIRFFYTFNRNAVKDQHYVEHDIADQAYFKMLSRLYSEKGSVGDSNLKFNDEAILEMLTPKQDVQAARNLRKKFEYNLKEYYLAEAKGENTDEFTDKLAECRTKIISQYTGRQSTLIPLLLEDMKTKRKRLQQSKASIEDTDESVPKLGAGVSGELYIDGEGNLKIAPPSEKQLALVEKNPGTAVAVAEHDIGSEIAAVISEDYDENATNANDFVKSLIVSTYAPTNVPSVKGLTSAEIDATIVKYDEQINMLEEVYCKARETFINEFSKIIESLMGVKIFFDHATVEGGEDGKLPEGVIIANCKASKLLEIEDKFRRFIKHRGKDQLSGRIWFAVLPGVMEKSIAKKSSGGKGPFGSLKSKKNATEVDSTEFTSLNSALKFLQIMKEARIMTVMSIRQKSGNTFIDLSIEEVRDKMNKLPKDNSHAVYAYPNFTLLRERPGFKPFKPYSNRTIALPGIYIDAAYPAAGLLVASQQQKYLENHGFKGRIIKDNVCVHLDFEREEVKKNLLTKFNRESELRWSEALRAEITQNMFGFVFCSDEVYDAGVPLKNSYILCARTLQLNNKTGKYKPIYQTLMEDYVAQQLKSGISNKMSDVKKFIASTVKGDWEMQSRRFKDSINLILQSGEEIVIDEEQKKVIIRFANDESTIDDFDIISDNV